MLWNGKESQSFTVGVNRKIVVTLSLRIPSDKHTRLIVQVGMDGILVSESHSDWFDT